VNGRLLGEDFVSIFVEVANSILFLQDFDGQAIGLHSLSRMLVKMLRGLARQISGCLSA
jgi:muramoyltetrapeptide carboxypeptidase LdcA involved in peptidoglycan recycling